MGVEPMPPYSTSSTFGLRPGDTLDNRKLCALFKCSSQGGLRRSLRTDSLVLVSDHTRSLYEDRWVDNVFHFTGMGLRGDQDLAARQNRTLRESGDTGVKLFLFEVFEPNRYLFVGRVRLEGSPYAEQQPDVDGKTRRVWKFPLRITPADSAFCITDAIIRKSHERKKRMARRLSNREIVKRACLTSRRAGKRTATAVTYEPDVYVAELAIRRANGHCQLCDQPAPFKDRSGAPHLEAHHIVWLSAGGEDTVENTVALCPNCHARMHVLNPKSDRRKLKKKAMAKNYQYTLFGDLVFC
jgi:5-methylcytosine-specific restriction protein A